MVNARRILILHRHHALVKKWLHLLSKRDVSHTKLFKWYSYKIFITINEAKEIILMNRIRTLHVLLNKDFHIIFKMHVPFFFVN